MADTYTTNLNLTKPEPGAAEDTWGISLNADLDALDAIFSSSGTQINLNPNQINFADGKKLIFGTGSDLQIYHDGSHSYIKDAGTGQIKVLAGTNLQVLDATGTNFAANFSAGGESQLYYNGNLKLKTTSSGISVTGTVTSDGLTVDGDATISDGNPTLSLVDTTATNQGAEFKHNAGTTTIQSSNTSTHGLIKFNSNNGTDTVTRMQIDRFGDISFYDDTGTTQGLFWDASAERLGIGTTSPQGNLNIVRTSSGATRSDFAQELVLEHPFNVGLSILGADGRVAFGDSADNDAGLIRYAHGVDSMIFSTAGTEALRLDSSQRVGIGTSSPSQKLEIDGAVLIKDSNTEGTLYLTNTSVGIKRSNAVDTANSRDVEVFTDGTGGNVVFSANGAGSAEMVVSDSGSVGIGTDSPSELLTLKGSSDSQATTKIAFLNDNGGNNRVYIDHIRNGNDSSLAFTLQVMLTQQMKGFVLIMMEKLE